MKQPLFSVIIPVFNAESYIERCLGSIFRQTFRELEIIAVDDGSTDRSLSILRQMEEEEPRLRVYTQSNTGASAARNVGIANSNGKYISFVDSDDWLEADAFEVLDATLKHHLYPDIVMFNSYINDAAKNKPFLKSGYYDKRGITASIYPRLIESLDPKNGSAIRASVCLRIFRRELVADGIWFDTSLKNNEDLVFCLRATLKATSFLYLGDSYLYHNCMTAGSLSRGYMSNAFERMKPLFGILSDISESCKEYDFSDQIKARVFRTFISCSENEFRMGNVKTLGEIYRTLKDLVSRPEIEPYLRHFTPSLDKSQKLYFFFYRKKLPLGMMLLSWYRVKKQKRRIKNV